MTELILRKDMRDLLSARGKEYVLRNNWDVRKQDYLDLVDSLSVGSMPQLTPPLTSSGGCLICTLRSWCLRQLSFSVTYICWCLYRSMTRVTPHIVLIPFISAFACLWPRSDYVLLQPDRRSCRGRRVTHGEAAAGLAVGHRRHRNPMRPRSS